MPTRNKSFRSFVTLNEIHSRKFAVDLDTSARMAVWLMCTTTLEGSIHFGPNWTVHNIFTKYLTRLKMVNVGPLLLVRPQQKFKCILA